MANDLSIRLDKSQLERLERLVPGRADDLIGALALQGEQIVKRSFGTSPAGRSYRRGTVMHIASRPGFPPNIDTGKLINAIHVYKPRKLERRISTGDVDYAPILEFGSSEMEARPFMRPMIVRLRDEVEPTMRDLIEGVL